MLSKIQRKYLKYQHEKSYSNEEYFPNKRSPHMKLETGNQSKSAQWIDYLEPRDYVNQITVRKNSSVETDRYENL